MWHTGGMFSSWWHGVWMIIWVLIIVAVIVLIVRALFGSSTSSSAREILDERYAKGEISKEEFLKKKADIEK